jgi:myxalamid-type polyketide synthase MxaE and MxaD
LVKGLEEEGVFCRRVKVDVASHSPQMDVLREELLEALKEVKPQTGRVPMLSTVKVREVEGTELDAGYWVKNLREPVMFGPAVEKLKQTGHTLFVELSPNPILAPAIEPALSGEGEKQGVVVGSLRREQPERERMLESLGRLYAAGLAVDWRKLYPAGRCVSLPTYPWQRKVYWMSKPAAASGGLEVALSGGHLLHGRRVPSPGREIQFASALSVARQPYMDDHRVFGSVVVPGAFHVAALISAAEEAFGPSVFSLEGMEFQRALVLEEGKTHRLHLLLSPAEATGEFSFQSASPAVAEQGGEETWRIHATGRLRVGEGAPASSFMPLADARARCTQARPLADIYENLKVRGIDLGPDFAWVTELWRGEGEALGVIQRPSSMGADSFPLHPSLVDGCFQVLLAAGPTLEEGKAYVPFSVERIRFHRRGAGRLFCHVLVRAHETPGPEMCVADFRLFDESGALLVDVEGFRIRQADPRKMLAAEAREPWAEWLYTPSWQRAVVTVSPRSRNEAGGRWVLFVDQGGLAARVGSELQEHGFSCVRVQAGDAFTREGPSLYTVRPERAEDFSALVSALLQEGPPLIGAVFLWSADAPVAEGMAPAALRAEQVRGYGAVLHWSQALTRATLRQLPRLWLVTRDVHAVGGSSGAVSLAQAPLWGLGRTLFYEHPDLRCACVDLSARSSPEDQARGLAQELLANGDEEEIALRPEGRFVNHVTPGAPGRDRAHHPITLKADGTYVLTGGLGGLGLAAARWLVARGARKLVLVSRQGADTPARREAVAALEDQGAKVIIAQADVADFAQLQAVLERAEAQLAPIKGVLHLAGVLEDGLLAQQDLERYRKVMGPKVLGAWNLHLLTRGKALDFFVLYSAGAALLGTPGQGNYAAANAFLDALAHHRRGLGLPGLSINWGAFAEVGLAAAAANRGARLAHRGVRSFSPDEAHAALEHLLGQDVAQVAVIAFDARQWMDYYPQAASSTRLSPVVKSSRERRMEPAKAAMREKLRETRGAERAALLEQFVQEQVAAVARLPVSAIDRHAALKSFGMDSLMGLELRNQLERGLGLRLPATLVWTYPNVAVLAEHLLSKIEPAPETPPAPAKAREVPAPAMAPISEAEKRALLEKELASLEELLR